MVPTADAPGASGPTVPAAGAPGASGPTAPRTPETDAQSRALERAHLIRAFQVLGYPTEVGELFAEQLGGPWSMHRMTGYLYAAHPTTIEQIADEMLAILEERRSIVERHLTRQANASWNVSMAMMDAEEDRDESEAADEERDA